MLLLKIGWKSCPYGDDEVYRSCTEAHDLAESNVWDFPSAACQVPQVPTPSLPSTLLSRA